ncbi:MAG TPA: urea carboxylase [Burkholderiales bacterium]|jgi:urea carboxylase|nr:urea carboxylase [Burkholderiales bacterium]
MFTKVLIANRGAIACRIIRTLKKLGVKAVAVYSETDLASLHVAQADEAVCIGPAPAAESYLRADRILQVAHETGAQAIHPGYGFLSENADFAEACERAGIAFIGPNAEQMRAFGLKHRARDLAANNDVPLLPGSGLLNGIGQARSEAARIGYPVMLKSTGGGGGIGMRLIQGESELGEAYASVERLARANFKDAGIFLEKYVQQARHIEVQIFGDGQGKVIALGERDCSVQRRNQKVIEETPAPNLPHAVRAELLETSVRLGQAVDYRSAGTVEYVLDAATGEFYFLEVNTRLQVEHGVTEEVTGVDLVEWMVKCAAGDLPPLESIKPVANGASIQVRLYAEDPGRNFQPCSGTLTAMDFPRGARIETWVEQGTDVPPNYDPMIAKIIVRAPDRRSALGQLSAALADTRIGGIETNLEYLRQIVVDPVFVEGQQTTRMLAGLQYRPSTVEVIEPGVQTSVQDWPGRLGYWDVGVPPSGPMDALALRLANRLLGNEQGAAALECTASGPTLKFHCDSVIAIAGAPMDAMLDGKPLASWISHAVKAGSMLKMGGITGAGVRTYLAVAGGFDVPAYLGAGATFTLGRFGGHSGRTLRVGDMLHLAAKKLPKPGVSLPRALLPHYTNHWRIAVLYGPHGAPDFFTPEDIDTLFATGWEVHYNSSRTGVRLIGPKPTWARHDGGEAGLHPSNIHDNAYAIGAIDFTGDMPVILGPDGPSLGGFVCPAVIVDCELWKMGQLKPGDRVRFVRVSQEWAAQMSATADKAIESLSLPAPAAYPRPSSLAPRLSPILRRASAGKAQVEVTYRQSGDRYLLVEYGPLVLDHNLRFRVHALMQWLQQRKVAGIVDLTPGIRSLQVHFDKRLPLKKLLQLLAAAEKELTAIGDMQLPTRIVHLPLSWDDTATRLAIEKYTQSVRKDAPWCPSNIEFIRRINGLDSIGDVHRIVFDASYLVLGLGDVYLGAPVATPMDPRHRLVTTKYNPARTWTPENAVGIGGAYLCVYGMEGPGGYQFVGRTLQMWNRYKQTDAFTEGKPWLLRFFDQIRFYPVSEKELLKIREDFPLGRYPLRIEEATFSLRDYNAFLKDNAQSITAFKSRQQAAFEAERERWRAAGQAEYSGDAAAAGDAAEAGRILPANGRAIASQLAGNVWKIPVKPGDKVSEGDALVIVESMKMEFPIAAPFAGKVLQVFCREGSQVSAGQDLIILEAA